MVSFQRAATSYSVFHPYRLRRPKHIEPFCHDKPDSINQTEKLAMDLPSISQKHTRGPSDTPYYDHHAAQRPLYVNDRLPSLPLPQPEQAYSSGTSSPQVGSLGSLSSSNPLNFRHNYPSLKRRFQDIDTPQSREAVLDYSREQLPETPQPAINPNHRLLSFSRLPENFTLSDQYGRRVPQIELSAQLHGMFFLSEMATPSGDGLLVQPQLTCYRRNLFQISGIVTIPTAQTSLFTERGEYIPIVSLDVKLSASESVEGHPVKLIVVPWNTPPTNANDRLEPESEPAEIPLDRMDSGQVTPPTASNGSLLSGASSNFSVSPIAYHRLQFRIATANNGRRRELQQHFTLHLNVVATTANGTKCNVCETSSAPIVVRGRSPRNFQAGKDIPLVGSSGSPGEDPKPNALEPPRSPFRFNAPNFPDTPALVREEL
jgi:hypothetical protein